MKSKILCKSFHAGIDEAGRGSWAGPVVSSAVILPPDFVLDGLNDSKILPKFQREKLFIELNKVAIIGIGFSSAIEICEYNILQASLMSMKRAFNRLTVFPDLALIDGIHVPKDLPCPSKAIIRGDSKVPAIAAASIIAKVIRDNHMALLDQRFPGYNWTKNAGYGVKQHLEAIKIYGISPEHRRCFKPIHNMLC